MGSSSSSSDQREKMAASMEKVRKKAEKKKEKEEKELIAREIEGLSKRTTIDEETGETVHYWQCRGQLIHLPEPPKSSKLIRWQLDYEDYYDVFDDQYAAFREKGSPGKERLQESELMTILTTCSNRHYNDLLEFYCVQELSLCDYWTRQAFSAAALRVAKETSSVGRLYPIKVIASYLIAGQSISKEAVIAILDSSRFLTSGKEEGGFVRKGAGELHIHKLGRRVIDDGIREFAEMIVATRDCLLEMDLFPTDLIPLLMSFVYARISTK